MLQRTVAARRVEAWARITANDLVLRVDELCRRFRAQRFQLRTAVAEPADADLKAVRPGLQERDPADLSHESGERVAANDEVDAPAEGEFSDPCRRPRRLVTAEGEAVVDDENGQVGGGRICEGGFHRL